MTINPENKEIKPFLKLRPRSIITFQDLRTTSVATNTTIMFVHYAQPVGSLVLYGTVLDLHVLPIKLSSRGPDFSWISSYPIATCYFISPEFHEAYGGVKIGGKFPPHCKHRLHGHSRSG